MSEETLEALKHKNAKELELIRWKFKKAELSYLEAGQHLRSLNQQLWQVPSMVIAITGGIWFAAAAAGNGFPRVSALYFAATVNILTIPTIIRLRQLIGTHISFQLKFDKKIDSKGNYTVITCWTLLLLTAAALSIAGALNTDRAIQKTEEKTQTTNNYLYPEKIEILKK